GVDIELSTSQDGHPQITFQQKGLSAHIITALGLDSNLSTRLSTPTEVGTLLKDVKGVSVSGHVNFPMVVGMLLYLYGHPHPNIAFSVHQVARYTFKPNYRHELALVWIGFYLKGTKD
ncbi:hypothetical protein ACHAW6_015446, partial [Cyclotella cf. meneghiniana]